MFSCSVQLFVCIYSLVNSTLSGCAHTSVCVPNLCLFAQMIHAIRVTKFLGPHWFCVDLDASAGTYIKVRLFLLHLFFRYLAECLVFFVFFSSFRTILPSLPPFTHSICKLSSCNLHPFHFLVHRHSCRSLFTATSAARALAWLTSCSLT